MRPGQVYIGTSGWVYEHWKGPFYPVDLPSSRMLDHYLHYFKSVELNSSFYHLPQEQTLAQWRDSVPAEFIFSVKASRYITHMKKLKDPQSSIKNFFQRIAVLEEKLGPILFQLPPHWRFNRLRLEYFLGTLSRDFRYAFEFRNRDWINEQTYTLLRHFDAAFCIYDLDGYLSPKEITTDFIYVRLHGPGAHYQGSYDERTLSGWAGALSAWARQGLSIYCYFDNDEVGYAAQNAQHLQSMLEGKIQGG